MGKIKINPANKGKFTAWARAHGMTVQQAAATILRNREKYSPTLIKHASFARSAAKWEDGGLVQYGAGGFLKSLAPLANFIPGVGPLISGAMGAFGGIMDAAGNANDQSAMIAKERRDNGMATARAGQAGAINPYAPTFKIGGTFKGKRFGGKPNAEVEGGEVLITPDGMQTSIGGPSHSQGGVDVNLPNNTMILSNKKSGKGLSPADEVRPYTSKINKAQEVVNSSATKLAKESAKRNLNKYYTKVFDAYNKQEAKKFGKGGKFNGGLPKFQDGDTFKFYENTPYQGVGNIDPLRKYVWPFDQSGQTQGNPYQLGQVNVYGNRTSNPASPTSGGAGVATAGNNEPYNPGSRAGYNAPDDLMTQPTFGSLRSEPGVANMNLPSTPVVAGQGVNPFDKGKFDWGNALGTVGEMAPMLYNLGQGLFGKRDKLRANDYANPYEGQINSLMANRKYNIDPELAANESAFRTTGANMRNLGGSRGQVMSNLTGAQNTKQFGDMSAYAQKKNMENQYAGEYAQTLYPLGRDRSMTKMMVDESNAMTDASGRNMIGAGMSGLQQYLLTRRQMKNQAGRDKMLGSVMSGFSPFMKEWFGPEFEQFMKTKQGR